MLVRYNKNRKGRERRERQREQVLKEIGNGELKRESRELTDMAEHLH